jgi:hypothetical protein
MNLDAAKVYAQAIEFDRRPLALLATCKLCGRITESFSLRRMDPAPRHHDDCVLAGYEPDRGAE